MSVAGLLGFTTLKSCRQIRTLGEAGDWVNQSHALYSELREIGSVSKSLGAILTAQQATGDRALLAKFEDTYHDLMGNVSIARALAATDPESDRRFKKLESLIRNHTDLLRSQLIDDSDLDDPTSKPRFAGPLVDGPIRDSLRDILRYQTEILTRHDSEVFEQNLRTETALATSTAIAFALLILSALVIARDVRRQQALEAKLRGLNAELEATVKCRTQDLIDTNTQLRQSSLELNWNNQALSHQLRYNLPIIDRVSDAVVIVTQTMHISRTNPAAKSLFNSTAEELFNRPIFELLDPISQDGGTNLKTLLETTLIEGREYTHPALARLRHPAIRDSIEFSIIPVRDNDSIVGALLILNAL